MKIPAKQLLVEHANEGFVPGSARAHVAAHLMKKHAAVIFARALELMPGAEEMARARASGTVPFVALDPSDVEAGRLQHMSVSFEPGPPRPVPPPQPFTHADIARRSIAGDDDDATPRLPSLRGFLAAAAASGDWGVPVRSTSDPERFGKGALRGGGGRPHDPHTGREHYALAQRELARVASLLPMTYGLNGDEQLAVWSTVAGAGRLELRNVHTGGTVDAIDREQQRAAKVGKKRRGKTMQPPAKRRAFLVPERKRMTATEVALELRRFDVIVTPHQVGLVCRAVTLRVRVAFEAKGWIREQTTREREAGPARERAGEATTTLVRLKAKGAPMAALTGYDLQGWKQILDIVGCSANTARTLMTRKERRLPVVVYLGTPNAKAVDLRRWQDDEVAAALAEVG